MKSNLRAIRDGILQSIAFAIVAIIGHAAFADDTRLAVGFGASNGACGTGEPTAAIDFDRDQTDVPMHFRMGVGPNGGCTGQSVTVDAQVALETEWHQEPVGDNGWLSEFFGVAATGYDSRTVPFEYDSAGESFKRFRGYRVETPRAMAGAGWRVSKGDDSYAVNCSTT